MLLYDLHGMESRLTDLTVKRRRERVTAPVVKRIATDLAYVFNHEAERVMDLLGQATLPYKPGQSSEAAVRDVEGLMRLILNGQDVNQYQAVLEDGYRTVMPDAMDMTLRQTLDAAGIKYRVGPLGDLFLLNGMKLTRFHGAEQWIRDNAIQFSRRWAPKVTAVTNKRIRATLADGMANFEDMMALRARVRKVYAAAKAVRSEMIARSETSRAYNKATVEMGTRLGLRKYWISSGSPYAAVDVCGENADMGTVAMHEWFRDLDGNAIDGPPAHVNCECSLGLDVPDDYEVSSEFVEEG